MVWFHGTTKEVSESIMSSGFKEGTFFAKNLETALHFGGTFIFEVLFEENPTDYWEWVSDKFIPSARILALYSLDPKVLYYGRAAHVKLKELHLKEESPEFTVCLKCSGKGQLDDYPLFCYWRDRKITTVCPDCKGYGSVEKMKEMKRSLVVKD